MKILKTKKTNIVHHEKIQNIIKFFLYFELKQWQNLTHLSHNYV
jgi:phosphate starvation-inducible membrane PsiE